MAGNRDFQSALAENDVQFVTLTHHHAREFAVQVGEAEKGTEIDLAVAQAQDESAASGHDTYVVLKIDGRSR